MNVFSQVLILPSEYMSEKGHIILFKTCDQDLHNIEEK